MHIIQAWKDSLRLFKVPQFKLFFLITVKSILQVYKIIGLYFWPFILGIIIHHNYCDFYPLWLKQYTFLIDVVLYSFFVFLIFLSIRSSVPKKTVLYYMRHLLYFFPFILWTGAIYWFDVLVMSRKIGKVFRIIAYALSLIAGDWGIAHFDVLSTGPSNTTFGYIPIGEFGQFWFVPLGVFFTFFMLDSNGKPLTILRSLWRALIMVLYNYPAVLLLYLFSIIVYGVILFAVMATPVALWAPWGLFLSPIPISVFANFYIKYVHDQFSIYFGEKKRIL